MSLMSRRKRYRFVPTAESRWCCAPLKRERMPADSFMAVPIFHSAARRCPIRWCKAEADKKDELFGKFPEQLREEKWLKSIC